MPHVADGGECGLGVGTKAIDADLKDVRVVEDGESFRADEAVDEEQAGGAAAFCPSDQDVVVSED